jgi:hypothetical protein
MFGILNNLTKAVVGVVVTPVAVIADAVTLGGTLTDKDNTYTGEQLSNILKNLEKATK